MDAQAFAVDQRSAGARQTAEPRAGGHISRTGIATASGARLGRVGGRYETLGLERGYVRAELQLLRNGRRAPITHDYRCDWDIGNTSSEGTLTINGGPIVLEGRDELQPGQKAVVRIHPIAPDLWAHVHAGMVINAHEGPRIVGIAKILEVIPPQERQRT